MKFPPLQRVALPSRLKVIPESKSSRLTHLATNVVYLASATTYQLVCANVDLVLIKSWGKLLNLYPDPMKIRRLN